MIIIRLSHKFKPEKEYIFTVIFDEFMGIEYALEWCEKAHDYEIYFEGKTIVVEDHFFSRLEDGVGYISKECIPKTVEFAQNVFTPEADIPVLFGSSKMLTEDGKVVCGVDIFATCFFMLSRWEEIADGTLDKHERFPATASLAYRYNFLHRPVVNEYTEMLWNMLKHLGFNSVRKKRYFRPVLTHDIDIPFKDFEKNGYDDPYNVFMHLMDKSEELGVKSIFYLMDRGVTELDKRYFLNDKQIVWLIDRIKKRGHLLGIHPSYASYNDADLLKLEIGNISESIDGRVELSRQHYLRFQIPTTWKLLDESGIKSDSTLCYADMDGFRCGCCYEYSVFDVLERKHLKLKESPLIAMETTFFAYREDEDYASILEKLIYYINVISKYSGDFVLLVHNSSFEVYRNRVDIYKLYDEVIEYLKKVKCE